MPVAGQKRKRSQASSADVPHAVHESKNQRKKRRRAERLAAEQANVVHEVKPIESSSLPVASRTRSKQVPLPNRPVTFRNTQPSGILPPVSWTASFSAHTAAIPPPLFSSLPPKPPPLAKSAGPLPSSLPHFPAPPILPPLPGRRPQPPHLLPPSPSTIPSALCPPFPQPLLDLDVSKTDSGQLAQKKILGMPRESDKGRQGIFPIETVHHPLPDPTRTLVLAPIPKKYRNAEFVTHWARKFTRQSQRIEVDKMLGKALVEFQNVALAERAHGSIRMMGEGKEHIRAWWYRGPAKNPSDLEEGEIEEGVVEDLPPQPQPNKKKQSKSQKKAEKKKQVAQMQRQQQSVSAPSASKVAFNASSFGLAPTPMSFSQPIFPPIYAVPPFETKAPVASSSRTMIAAPSSPNTYGYRGAVDNFKSAGNYRFIGKDSDPDDESNGLYQGASYGHYSTTPKPPNVYQEEEQAMDLESDDDEASPREKFSPGSRYVALAETAMTADSATAADDASIASSRAGSAERESADRMCVDDEESASAPAPPVVQPNGAATRVPSALSPPKLPAKLLPPSVFTMVEPPAALVFAPALDVSAVSEPPHSTTEPTRSMASSVPVQPGRLPLAGFNSRVQDQDSTTAPAPLPAAVQVVPSDPPKLSDSANTPPQLATHTDSSTHMKRSLLEKQRELEERIARAREELARKDAASRASASRNASPEEESNKVVTFIESTTEKVTPSTVIVSAESELRRSALQSRRKTVVPPADFAEGTLPPTDIGSVDDTSTPVGATSNAINFEDLAVSFITETLQTVRPSPPFDPPSATNPLSSHSVTSTAPTTPQPPPAIPSFLRPSQTTERSLLAAKQKRLEQHLVETKMLMTSLSAARTKAERDTILGTLRERQR